MATIYPYRDIDFEWNWGRSLGAILILPLAILPLILGVLKGWCEACAWFVVMMSLVPSGAFYATTGNMAWAFVSYGLIPWLFYAAQFFVVSPKLLRSRERCNRIENILIACTIIFSLYFILTNGFKLDLRVFTLDSEFIYDTRAAANDGRGKFSRYLYSWTSKLLVPLAFFFAIRDKKRYLSIFWILFMAYLFATSGHKSVLLSAILLLATSKLKRFELINRIIIYGLLGVTTISLTAAMLFDFLPMESLLVRRMLVLPALLDQYYFAYYQDSMLFYSHSFLGEFFRYDSDLSPAYTIGDYYLGSDQISANDGYLSDGFINIGFVGVALHILIVVTCVALLDFYKVSCRYFGLIFIYLYQLNTSALSVVLLQHGLLLLLIIAATGLLSSKARRRANQNLRQLNEKFSKAEQNILS